MKLHAWKHLTRFLVPALTVALLGIGTVACSSSDEGAADGDPASAVEGNNVANPNSEGNGDALAANGTNEGQTPEDQVAPEEGVGNIAEGNPAGNELQQMVNADGAAAAPANADMGLNNGTTGDPMAADAGATALGGDVPAPPADVAMPDGVVADAGAAPAGDAPAGDVPAADAAAAAPADPFVAEGGAAPTAGESAPVAAASTPQAGALPENGAKMAYYIQKGDTLATIAQKIFGNRALWKTLQAENSLSDPNLIYAGDVVYYSLNDTARPFAEKYETAARQSVTVQTGDTLSKIARKVFGSEFEWRTLWKENPQVKNPDVVKVGTVLTFRAPGAQTAQTEFAPATDGLTSAVADTME